MSNIPIRNIYYMLSYAFSVLKESGYKKVALEQFDNVANLGATILLYGVKTQIKQGLSRDYIQNTDELTVVRGQIDVYESVRKQSIQQKKLICKFDEFSANFYLNQIIKSTFKYLLKADIDKDIKSEIRKILLYFVDISDIDINAVNWKIRFNRNNKTYEMLISMCYIIIKGLLQTQFDGTVKIMDYIDERVMNKLYEKFVLEYYRQEYPQFDVRSSQINWQIDNGEYSMLPMMKSDIMISFKNKILIIDTKYYSHNLQTYYDVNTINTNNLYQIFAYVKNKTVAEPTCEIAGMLLYAKTLDSVQPNDIMYQMSGNNIYIKTLDLNVEFEQIKSRLNEIAEAFLN